MSTNGSKSSSYWKNTTRHIQENPGWISEGVTSAEGSYYKLYNSNTAQIEIKTGTTTISLKNGDGTFSGDITANETITGGTLVSNGNISTISGNIITVNGQVHNKHGPVAEMEMGRSDVTPSAVNTLTFTTIRFNTSFTKRPICVASLVEASKYTPDTWIWTARSSSNTETDNKKEFQIVSKATADWTAHQTGLHANWIAMYTDSQHVPT